MLKIYLRQLGFTYSSDFRGPFTKNKGRIQKFKKNMGFKIYL